MNNPQPTTTGQSVAIVHVHWRNQERAIPVPVPQGRRTLADLLPAALEISQRATAMAVEQVQAQGLTISCRAGCGACCRQLVAISVVEAQALADLVAALPAERQAEIRRRFAGAVDNLEKAGLLDPADAKGDRSLQAKDLGARAATLQELGRSYYQLQIPCPFLENESCSIHSERPTVCREHHVTTPAENCAKVYQIGVDRVEPPVRMGEVLARTIARTTEGDTFMIPLVLALEWSEVHGPDLKKLQDGRALFQVMMEELQNPS